MTIYNTSADAANTAIRAFLTRVGEYYLSRSFNTGSGKAKDDWNRIKLTFSKVGVHIVVKNARILRWNTLLCLIGQSLAFITPVILFPSASPATKDSRNRTILMLLGKSSLTRFAK